MPIDWRFLGITLRRSLTQLLLSCRARRHVVFVTLAVLAAAGSWTALTPRRDWHDIPIQLLPLKFQAKLGHLAADTALHTLVALLVPLVLVFALDLPRTTASALKAAGTTLAWLVLIELAQGFLPYRNFELTDMLANCLGTMLAFGYLHKRATRAAATPQTSATSPPPSPAAGDAPDRARTPADR